MTRAGAMVISARRIAMYASTGQRTGRKTMAENLPDTNVGNKRKSPGARCFQRVPGGAATQIRTGDLILTKDVLYRLSHISTSDIIADNSPFVKDFFKVFLCVGFER